MAPIVSPAQHMTTRKRYMAFTLREETFGKRRGNVGSGDEVEERDTSSNPISSLLDFALERFFGPGKSKTKPVPISQAEVVSSVVKTAGTTHQTGPQSAPMSAPHATSISLTHSSSILPPLQSNPPGTPSPSLSPPPLQKHSISSHDQGIGAGVGSAVAVGLLIVLFFLLRRYCRQGWSIKQSNRIDKKNQRNDEAHPEWKHLTFEQKRKAEEAHPSKYSKRARETRTGGVIEMVRPTQTQRRDFGSQFSLSLESELQRVGTEDQEAVADEDEGEARESTTGGVSEMVRPTQTQRRDFRSQFSPNLESQLERTGTEDQQAGEREDGAETVEPSQAGPSQRRPTVPDHAISSFMLPSPIVSVAETTAVFNRGDARVVCRTPPSDGEDAGRVVGLGDSCVNGMAVRVMRDDDDDDDRERRANDEERGGDDEERGGDYEERRGVDGERRGNDEERKGDDRERVGIIVAQARREIDGAVITVTDLGTRVVEEVAEEERGGEGRAHGDGGWSPHDADVGDRIEDHQHLDGRELDREDESDNCSFKSMKSSMEEDKSEEGELAEGKAEEGELEEGGRSGDDEQTEGAGRDVGAAGRVENAAWLGTASPDSEGGTSGYEGDVDP